MAQTGTPEWARIRAVTSPSDLDKHIDLQAQTRVPDGGGGFTTVWISMLPSNTLIWAGIWPISARDIVQANATVMVISHRIRIRYRSVLKTGWRVKFGNRYFSIIGITCPNEAREFLDIMAKEVTT